MKSDETSFMLGLFQAQLKDVLEDMPELRVELCRDWQRLCSLVEKRGLWFLTSDLPQWGKHFDLCLAAETYTRSNLVSSKPFRKGGVIPNLFRGLLLRVFDESGMLRSDFDVQSIRWLRQLFTVAKKYEKECTNENVFRSVDEFFEVEQSLRHPTLPWDGDELLQTEAPSALVCGRLPYGPRPWFGQGTDGNRSPGQDRSSLRGLRNCGELLGVRSTDEFRSFPVHVGGLDFLSFCEDPRDPHLTHPDFLNSGCDKEKGLSIERWWLTYLQETADIISATLGRFDPAQWKLKHGPGAVSDRCGASKYSFPHWPDKLELIFPQADFAHANYSLWADELKSSEYPHDRFSRHEAPSRLLAVPKEQSKPRLIASEPISHQWCQQSVMEYFTTRIRSTPLAKSISFRDQTPNQRAARQASLDGKSWTIDLSSASDRVSCYVVERFFRANVTLLQALHATRTRWIENSIGGNSNPRYHRLRKFSTMGSACTFPVETIIFAGIAVSSVLISRNIKPSIRSIKKVSREVRVFGDDIIVPSDAGSVCVALLANLNFKVNTSKTFGTGKFRESCGMDAYNGVDVTPVRIRRMPLQSSPESVKSVVDTHNSFVASHMYSTASFLKQSIPENFRKKILNVWVGSGVFGFWNHGFPCNDALPSRVNKSLHVREVRALVPIGANRRTPNTGRSSLLQYFTEAPSPETFWKSGVVTRPILKLRDRWVVA